MNNLLRTTTALAAFGLLSATPSLLRAASPNLVGYQGVLRDGGGNPQTGTFAVTFTIYVAPAGGAGIWTEAQSVTTDVNGSFSIMLGSITALDETVFSGENSYLGVTVSPDPEMTPRQRLGSVPYAHRVGTVDSASGGTVVGDVVITSGIGGQLELRKSSGVAGVSLYAGVGGEAGSSGATLELTDGPGTVRISMDADLAGDPSVLVPNGAISAVESSNEPGVANDNSTTNISLTLAVSAVLARSITAPSAGYVLVIGSAQLKIVNDNFDSTVLGVSNNSGAFPVTGGLLLAGDMASPVTEVIPVSDNGVFPVTAGAHTFYLLAQELRGTAVVEARHLSLAFFPTAYGTVEGP